MKFMKVISDGDGVRPEPAPLVLKVEVLNPNKLLL